jgi:type IV pilus assembly protein PilY1
MWRLDLSSPVATTWKLELFADAFPQTLAGATPALIGQPIQIPPAVSVDQVGNPIVYFATGAQDNFSASDKQNAMWAVSERADVANNKITGTPLWHLGYAEGGLLGAGVSGNWINGVRVTGPISVFNGAVYFATYSPPANNAPVCALSDSTVWAVSYATTISNYVPAPAFIAPALGITTAQHGLTQTGQLIFGVGVQRTPPCFDDSSSQVNDSYVGYSGMQNVSSTSSGDFRLMWQTSPTNVAKSGDQQTSTNQVMLTPPPSGVRISSWASVVE